MSVAVLGNGVRATPEIRCENLTLGFDGHPAVHHLHGAIAPGALLAIVGPNGSGKTTLLRGLMGQLAPLGGRVVSDRSAFAYLPQQAGLDRAFPLTVRELVTLGAWRSIGLFRRVGRDVEDSVTAALGAVGLTGFDARPIDKLSGGQLQRALFARVIVQDEPVILLDEPFNAVDRRTSADLMRLIHTWHRDGRTVIAVLHDIGLARAAFPESLLLAREPVAWGATCDVLTDRNLARADAMAEQWDEGAAECEIAPDHGHTHSAHDDHLGHGDGVIAHVHAHPHVQVTGQPPRQPEPVAAASIAMPQGAKRRSAG
ncbi:MAG: ABC transporter ATP-binding protein [Pseudomonadota bacterium]